MEKTVVFIGFGEAAFYIAKGLYQEGLQGIVAYDVMAADARVGPVIRARAQQAGVALADSIAEAVQGGRFILSLTSGKLAVGVAGQVLPFLRAGQFYLDCNSASPQTKRDIAALPRPDGVGVVDATIMSAVPLNGHRVPILLAGEGSEKFFDALTPYGMNLEVLDAQPGGAAAVKLLRSVFIKALPQVLLECMLAARTYGVLDKIIDSVNGTITGKNMQQLADRFFTGTLLHAKRRSAEAGEAAELLEQMGLDASMSRAAQARLERLAALGLNESMDPDGFVPYSEILDRILEKTQQNQSAQPELIQ
jgi:3-hydroxyisobutyrate dehydrogenase-like beta-hydroxyacid dehydrogenase